MHSWQNGTSNRVAISMTLSLFSFLFGPILNIPGIILGKMEINAIRKREAPLARESYALVRFHVGIGWMVLYVLGVLGLIFFWYHIALPGIYSFCKSL